MICKDPDGPTGQASYIVQKNCVALPIGKLRNCYPLAPKNGDLSLSTTPHPASVLRWPIVPVRWFFQFDSLKPNEKLVGDEILVQERWHTDRKNGWHAEDEQIHYLEVGNHSEF